MLFDFDSDELLDGVLLESIAALDDLVKQITTLHDRGDDYEAANFFRYDLRFGKLAQKMLEPFEHAAGAVADFEENFHYRFLGDYRPFGFFAAVAWHQLSEAIGGSSLNANLKQALQLMAIRSAIQTQSEAEITNEYEPDPLLRLNYEASFTFGHLAILKLRRWVRDVEVHERTLPVPF